MPTAYEKHESLQVAERVLRELNRLGRPKGYDANDVSVQAYSNCREQGYTVVAYPEGGNPSTWVKVSFAQARGSEQIVVLHGPYNEFAVNGNYPQETDNVRDEYFQPGQYVRAARFVRKVLAEALKATKAAARIADRELHGHPWKLASDVYKRKVVRVVKGCLT